MILARAYYELFDYEAKWLDENPTAEFVELTRQVRLDVEDDVYESLFIAWNWAASGSDYFVDISGKSFCVKDEAIVRDVSDSPLWCPLVGQELRLSYLETGKQVLSIQAGDHTIYCCSFGRGMWGMDILTIARRLPHPVPV
jgi:hypothetical protein